jgi:hypothetical protein
LYQWISVPQHQWPFFDGAKDLVSIIRSKIPFTHNPFKNPYLHSTSSIPTPKILKPTETQPYMTCPNKRNIHVHWPYMGFCRFQGRNLLKRSFEIISLQSRRNRSILTSTAVFSSFLRIVPKSALDVTPQTGTGRIASSGERRNPARPFKLPFSALFKTPGTCAVLQ